LLRRSKFVHGQYTLSITAKLISLFQYTTFLIPDTHYGAPFYGNPASNPPRCTPTVHGQYPIYRQPLLPTMPNVEHFGTLLTIAAPPLATAAMLIAFTTRQLSTFLPPPGLPRRAQLAPEVMEAMAVEDVREFNEIAITKLVPRCPLEDVDECTFTGEEDTSAPALTSGSVMVSMFASKHGAPSYLPSTPLSRSVRDRVSSLQHEHDWLRLTSCYNPWLEAKIKTRIYTPGMLDGLWAGRWFVRTIISFLIVFQNPS
jgi:hypothetical protein